MELITAQLSQGHPLVTLIERSLHNSPAQRPTIDEVLVLTEQAVEMCAGEREECEMTKLELIQTLHSRPGSEVDNVYVVT